MGDSTLVPILTSLVSALRTQLGIGSRNEQLVTVEHIEKVAIEWMERASRWKGPQSPQAIRARVIVADMNVEKGDYESAVAICAQVLESSLDRLGQTHLQRLEAIKVYPKASTDLV